ncbi:MAG: hypothetical protein H6576_00550 [Lewinellaceae bacterium]|nr:hypothetical protein [Saprospiraceae bacterium]MCB9342167.1 hypothetical protein [Lewinellaceae bacterium]
MDLQKTKIYLDKLNREYARMVKDPENVMRLDIDIMASYVRELYDAINSDDPKPVAKHEAPAVKKAPAPAPAPIPEPEPEPTPPPAPVRPTPPSPVVMEEPPAPDPPKEEPPKPQTPAPAPAPKSVQTPPGMEVLFEEKEAKELSEKLSELPIADLKKAIALNDRLLLTAELFSGDGKAFESAIGTINGLSSYEDAKGYLIENCVVRYAWTDKKRVETAKNFIKLVRRRFK